MKKYIVRRPCNCYYKRPCPKLQRHVHEFTGSVKIDAPNSNVALLHNHRFAGVSGEAIGPPARHVHQVLTRTDFFFNHFHRIRICTGPPILVRDSNNNIIGHVHAITGVTEESAEHTHEFKANTLIQNPIDTV